MAVGNWKMHKTVSEAISAAVEISKGIATTEGVEVMIAPSFTALQSVVEVIRGTAVKISAQDLYWEDQGMFTGEVSPVQLIDVGCDAVLIGHSERRRYFHETDETVSRKTKAAFRHGLVPIVCVGETLDHRQAGQTDRVLGSQIQQGLVGVDPAIVTSLVVAYEPVWAIGTGLVANPDQIAESHRLIRKRLSDIFDGNQEGIPILYGGSVTPENINELVTIKELDGVLVGGASLNAEEFLTIIRALMIRN